jgi:hypothetical protein
MNELEKVSKAGKEIKKSSSSRNKLSKNGKLS